jgi:hypothetical protein
MYWITQLYYYRTLQWCNKPQTWLLKSSVPTPSTLISLLSYYLHLLEQALASSEIHVSPTESEKAILYNDTEIHVLSTELDLAIQYNDTASHVSSPES